MKLRNVDGTRVAYRCPCGDVHVIDRARWSVAGDADNVTISPSVLYETRATDPSDPDAKAAEVRCHSFVRENRVQFLDDCTHTLKGQTVDLPDWSGW